MGQIHNELRRGVLVRGVKAILGDSDGTQGIERYSETLQPILDPWSQPEWQALIGLVPFAAAITQTKVAGERAFVGVQNPVASGLIVVVQKIAFRTPDVAASIVAGQLANNIPAQDATSGIPVRDRRVGSGGAGGTSPGTRAQGVRGATAAGLGTVAHENSLTESVSQLKELLAVPQILIPGFTYILEMNVVNLDLIANFVGYERNALPGELKA